MHVFCQILMPPIYFLRNTANGLLFSFDQNSFEERLINITNMTFNHTLIAKDIQARYNLKRIIHKYEDILK